VSDWKDDCIAEVVNQSKGGQHVGLTSYTVRVKHVPTGIIAECGYHRSQHKNKEAAMQMIEWALVGANWPLSYCEADFNPSGSPAAS